ncbi:UNVERIFIED_CONTAM: Kinesin-like protein KIN-7D, mitochondrial [Sesamum radiatum]|uniref:Kinesin-like protein KIN-7D, mitochondrial n=1 Tax=Sesamum radiatum TaxID=300843 RepID=A0AAW2RV52_SESRA
MAASSSRGRSSSPFHYRKPSSPYSSTSSSSSLMNGRLMPRSCSSSTTSFHGGGGGYASRSTTPSRNRGDYPLSRTPVSYPSAEDQLVGEPVDDAPRSGDSISVTIRFRPLSEREYQRGDEIAWYPDGDKIVRNEYNPMTAYAFDRVFGPNTITEEVYEVAARPVVKAAMEGINEHRHVGSNNFNLFSSRSHTIFTLLEEGQVKMQSRLEEEEEAKAALMSRIQRLTKLILVSSKNTIPGYLGDMPSHQRSHSASEDDKLDVLRDGSLKLDGENQKDSSSSALTIPSDAYHFKHRRSSSKWNDDISQAGSTITETTQVGELISGSSCASKLPIDEVTMSDHMDLLVEQVKMLAGEIAFGTSTLKRLVEQSMNDPESSKTQIENLEREIQEKRKQMRVLEQRIVESGEASVANASMVEMQQTIMKLKAQCSEKGFELEIKSADNRVLQEQLQNKCTENKELAEKIILLEQKLASNSGDNKSPPSENFVPDEYTDELRKKIQSQEIENEKLKLEHVQILEENSGLCVQNQKLSEEASYAKELASAAAVELKNLAGEVTKLSLQNAKLEKEVQAARELSSRSSSTRTSNGVNRKHNDFQTTNRRGRISGRGTDPAVMVNDDFDSWDLDPDDLKMELQARKQREVALEAALAEKEILEDEYRKKFEEAKKREAALENDLANMWVLVARLKKEGSVVQEAKVSGRQNEDMDQMSDLKVDDVDCKDPILQDQQGQDNSTPASAVPKEEPLVVRLKARMQEMKEKELRYTGNGDANSHVCKVCFESPTAAMLLPCRHFCWISHILVFTCLLFSSNGRCHSFISSPYCASFVSSSSWDSQHKYP